MKYVNINNKIQYNWMNSIHMIEIYSVYTKIFGNME